MSEASDRHQERHRLTFFTDVVDGAVITEHDVVTLTHVDRVAEVTTKDDVIAGCGIDRISPTIAKGCSFHPADGQGQVSKA